MEGRRVWLCSAAASIIFLILALRIRGSSSLSLSSPSREGVCHHGGLTFPNGSSWRPGPCQRCECKGWVSLCQEEKCFDPFCPSTHTLHRHPVECCPYCKPPLLPCLAGQDVYQDGEVWSSGGCEECRCVNGTVSCGHVHCDDPKCSEGQVALRQEGQCCPECVSLGRPCKVGSEVHIDGSFWSPAPCSHCRCSDGRVQCYVPDCPLLACPLNFSLQLREGSCCPTCQGKTCHRNGTVYMSSEQWREDECSTCVCVDGNIRCSQMECPALHCSFDERLYLEEGSCCPSCVKKQGWCLLENDIRMPSGSLWNSTDCELCVCREGEVICDQIVCDRADCGSNEVLTTPAGACCSKCILDNTTCFYEGEFKKNGEVWTAEDCQVCSCSSGKVTCYIPNCAPCPLGMAPVHQNSKDCCPECQPAGCPLSCLSCDTDNSIATCDTCKEGYYLRNGRCVDTCEEGWFIESGECSPCHPTCASCSQATQFHCTKCHPEVFLREGECVEDCGKGFFAKESLCLPCHESCSECSGPKPDQCQVCPDKAFLLSGTCVDACPVGFYARGRSCEMCEENCQECGVGECLRCADDLWLLDGHCVEDCSPGTYRGPDNICMRCHHTCTTCHSAGVASCTSCPHYLLKNDSSCVSICPRNTFMKEGACHPCHNSCTECIGPEADKCVACATLDQVVVMRNSGTAGRCQDTCPPNYQLLDNICMSAPEGCTSWHISHPTSCQVCEDGWLLQDQECVQECKEGYFMHQDGIVCLPCDPRCLSCSGPEHTDCLSCNKGATLHKRGAKSECLTKCYHSNYLSSDNTCQACHKTCNACAMDHRTSNTICMKCKAEKKIPEGDQCVLECSHGFYFNEYLSRCMLCHPSCESCSGPHLDNCLTCSEGYHLNSMGLCVVDECPKGFYLGTNSSCSECEGDCDICSPDGTTCITCPSNLHLLYGKCVSRCPQMFYSDASKGGECHECHWACKHCLGPKETDCLSCADNAFQEGNSCVTLCSPGHHPVGGECRKCPPGCSACNSNMQCLECHSPYLLQDDHCVTSCQLGTFANVFENVCFDCGEKCLSCSVYECQKCKSPYLLQDGQCIDECSPNYHPDSEGICLYNTEKPLLHVLKPLTVDYGKILVLNSSNINVEDKDTPSNHLSIIFVKKPSNGNLYIIKEGNNILVSEKEAISVEHLMKNRLFFRHEEDKPLHGKITFTVFDGLFHSEKMELSINVKSLHDPQVILNEPLIVYKGKSKAIDTKVLNIHDQDNPEEVQVMILGGPKHGQLSFLNENLVTFKLRDLAAGQILYMHDNSDSEEDTVLFQLSDGYSVTNFLFSIYIVEEEKSKPVLVKNLGTHVSPGQSVQLTPHMLRASDIDSDDENLLFTLLPMLQNPGHGKLSLVIPLPPAPDGFYNDGWTQMDESHLVRPATSFTQRELNEGLVWYLHSGGKETKADELIFSVTDNSHPPNILGNQSFIIQIDSLVDDTMLPTPGTQLEITVQDGQAALITQAHLSFVGVKSPEHLVYTITHPLSPNDGSLFHIDSPGLELRQFTQADIDDMKIIYMPPLGDMIMQEKQYSFKFSVSDQSTGKGYGLPEQKFTIHVVPQLGSHFSFTSENPELVIRSHEAVRLEPEFFAITNSEPDDEIEFILLEGPFHGTIIKESDGEEFTFTEEDSLIQEELQRSLMKYVHDGSDSTYDYIVFVALGLRSEASTRISIIIRHEDQQQPIRGSNASFSLSLSEYESKVITSWHLHFTDVHSSDDELVYTLTTQSEYGNLVITEPSGFTRIINGTDKFTQSDIVYGLVNYSSIVEIGPEDVTENLIFNVTDSSNNVLSNQVLKVLIQSVDNEAPEVGISGHLLVDEGGSTVIPPVFTIADVDTPVSRLNFIIDAPPIFGYITNALSEPQSRAGTTTSVFNFPLFDVLGGKIKYVQSQHRHQEPVEDSFLFHITDGINESPLERLNISIQPKNDESPVILGEQVVLEQGKTVVITNQSLFISDSDTDNEQLIIKVVQPPVHGSIHRKASPDVSIKKSELLGRDRSFTFQDIIDDLILYSHDGSREPEDVMEIMVNDGNHETGGLVEFIILQKMDETPRLRLNEGITLKSGEVMLISSSLLLAEDMDSEADMIKYVVTGLPISGELEIFHPHRGKWVPLTVGSVFMQKDILDNNVRFVHQKDIPSGKDTLRFNLQDTEGNVMMDQALSITVLEDKIPPTITINTGLTLKEDASAAITAEMLSSMDAEMDPMELEYMLVSGPDHGHLELTTGPGKSITTWTQGALELGILRYQHQTMDESTSDQFTFTITDGYNNVTDSFFINIIPVDDELPFLVLNSIKAQEGARKILSQFELEALDVDTKDRQIVFTVVRQPRHGKLELKTSDGYTEAEVFSMLDIYNGDVSYLHDGSDTAKDSFKITLSDSTNKMYRQGMGEEPTNKPTSIHIEISSVDDGTPILTANRGLNYLQQEDGKAFSFITTHELHTEDEDTPPENLRYSITHPPSHGVVRLTTNQRPVSSFTQADVIGGRVQYELTTYSQNVSSDHFTFDVSDSKPNIVTGNIFHVQWAWFAMESRELDINESSGMAKIKIKRMGNLKQPSSVTCVSRGGSAEGSLPGRENKDFLVLSEPVSFEEGESEKFCIIPIYDDEDYEGPEVFTVKLADPNYSLLGKPKKTVIRISDDDDKPQVLFEAKEFEVDESDGIIYARLRRTGDVNQAVSVMCITEDGSAVGSYASQESDIIDDFAHRPSDKSSLVVFPPGVGISTCSVKINDDNKFESVENFHLLLKEPSEGVELGEIHRASVIIKGPNDQSTIGFSMSAYNVSETEATLKITLERSGVDLSYPSVVWCATKPFNPEEAQPSLDYIPSSEQVHFPEHERIGLCTINLVDDKLNPRLEGPERFKAFISTPQNATLSDSSAETVVTILDDEDMPSVHFMVPEIKVRENQTTVKIPVQRTGDLSRVSSVYCFTRQRSAKAGIDFMERPNTKESTITFPKGVSKVECEVGILDDLMYEKEEEFIVKLSHPDSPSELRPYISENKVVRVIILDWEDRPRISLEESAYTVAEPHLGDHSSSLKIPIIRLGDISKISRVVVSTQDGSAESGSDYYPLHTTVEFASGTSMAEVDLTILHNSNRQWHKTFTLTLGPEEPFNAEFGAIVTASITVLDHESSGTSVLPAPPIVVSLLHYDNVDEHVGEPASPGYPLVCVTPCDVRYPNSDATLAMCAEAGLNSSSMQYSWEVAIPAEGDSVLTPFNSLTDNTIFASPHKKILDSMFFARHFRVRCIAQPVRSNGIHGIPLRSKPVLINSENGICQTPLVPGQPGGFQSQSFIASLSYVNSSDETHPNTVKIYIEIPHQDGMVPLVSTLPIHNLRYLLTEKLYRVHHMCSSLDEAAGFLDEPSQAYPPHPRPHQWDENLRESKTLKLYRHLDLKSCLWTFSAWFTMSQLVDQCGGQVISDFQVGSGGQSFLTVRVPLYVSYVYATSPPGWASLDHRTELSVSLYYNTLLWHQGLHTEPILTAKIQVTRITIDESGRLVIDLKTHAKFRGQFVLRHSGLEGQHSSLRAPEDMDIKFNLELLWTASTWDGPEQVWRATSEYNLKDYTGEYVLELIPCTVSPTQAYEKMDEPACTPHPPKAFALPVAIQQSQRPVPLIYTLNTDFQLLNSPNLFLKDPRKVDNLQFANLSFQEVDYKGSYGPGETIYGRVLWHPSQDLHSAYQLYIQRVFLCTGVEGYVPTYDPTGELYKEGPQYGCIQPSSRLRHRFLILDREQPYITESNLSSSHVEAYFAEDLPEFQLIRQFSGVDGFLLKTDALYKVNSGHQWYLQVLYTIGPSNSRNKRDVPLHSVLSYNAAIQEVRRQKRHKKSHIQTNLQHPRNYQESLESLPTPEFLKSLHTRNGTNMRSFILNFASIAGSDNSVFLSVLYVVMTLVILLIIIIIAILLVRRHYRKSGKEKVIVVRSLKNEREEVRRKGIGRSKERPKTLPSNMTLNSESNLKTVKVKTLAITVRNNLEDEGTEV
ncbi:extracellular matrix organizing protein FRAS1-like isoform X1 [Macrobrachium nipponense]|uniref:extracellular matrix organizing protein FRAS1-like isoform X1 n=1 Tax=Macrobrachium nipponense TaxID=159736 RepID=UPI0030C7AF14